MMKFLFKIGFIFILLFGFSNYANYLFTGKTPEIDFKKPSLSNVDISKIKESISEEFESVKENVVPVAEGSYLYKWRDKKGIIHYTSEKPSGNIENLESIKLSNHTNILPAVSDNEAKTDKADQQQALSPDLPANIYSPEGIKHLFDQAKSIQSLMNEQSDQQKNIINKQ